MAEAGQPGARLPALLGSLMTPLPLFPLQIILARMVKGIARRRPELFARLGPHVASAYVIDVAELPFVLRLKPDPQAPELSAHRRWENVAASARIAGPFIDLFRIIDGRGDSDAMFFSGSIKISGDTEAATCLRYALDDLEGSVVEDLMEMGGPLLLPAHLILRRLRQLEMQH